MNHYEQKLEARRESLLRRAEKLNAEAESRAKRALEGLPEGGEPIKVGHHSEKSHRAAIARSDMNMRKACEAYDASKEAQRRAASVGTGGISSDDPDAIEKLQADLEDRRAAQQSMKAINAAWKKAGSPDLTTLEEYPAAILAVFESYPFARAALDKTVATLRGPHFAWERKHAPYQPFALTNNNASIKRIEDRIKELEKKKSMRDERIEGRGYVCRTDVDENRVIFEFDTRSNAAYEVMKRHAFKWSPTRKAWVRQLTGNALYAAKSAMKELNSQV